MTSGCSLGSSTGDGKWSSDSNIHISFLKLQLFNIFIEICSYTRR